MTAIVRIESGDHKRRPIGLVKYILNRLFRCSQHLLEWVPYRKDSICCVTLTRKGYVDNMKYVTQALMQKDPGLKIVWVTRYPGTCGNALKNGLRVVSYHTMRHFYLQFTSRIILSDDQLYHGLIIRREQVYINVWHGGINYKRLGREGIHFEDALMRKIFWSRNPSPDYMVAGCRFFEENMRSAFGFDKTVFLACGLPRNDMLFDKAVQSGRAKAFYGIRDKKVILYAPTFRERAGSQPEDLIDAARLGEAAHRRFGGEWAVLYRAHYFVSTGAGRKEYHGMIDVTGYEDMQEILLDTDILISDHSSCIWDYSFLGRPIVLFTPDEEDYRKKERGYTRAGRELPFPRARDMDGLVDIIEAYDLAADKAKADSHHRRMGSYEKGDATEYVASFILEKLREVQTGGGSGER